MLIFKSIWTTYQLGRSEPTNIQRYLHILEATFESSPQLLISIAFVIKTNKFDSIVLILSVGGCNN